MMPASDMGAGRWAHGNVRSAWAAGSNSPVWVFWPKLNCQQTHDSDLEEDADQFTFKVVSPTQTVQEAIEEIRTKEIVRRKIGKGGKMMLEIQSGGETVKIKQGTEDAETYTMQNLDGYTPKEGQQHGAIKARIWGKTGAARGKADGGSPTKRGRTEAY